VEGFVDIDSLKDAVINERLDFAFISPAAYVEVGLTKNLRILSTITQTNADGYSPWLAGAVFTRASRTDINSLADVRDKNVVALSEIALGGWLSAVREWQDLGIEPEKDFSSLVFNFSYADVVAAVCTGEMDVGVIAANTLPAYLDTCPEELKVLPQPRVTQDISFSPPHSTRLYPEVAFIMVGTHDEEFIRLLTRALLTIEHDSPVAQAVNVCGFTAPLPYTEVESLMQELGVGPFRDLNRMTIQQLLLDNITPITLVLLAIIAITSVGYINAHRLSRRVRATESFRKLVFEGSQIPMVIVNPENYTYLDMNKAAVELYGYKDKEELINMPLMKLTDPEQDIDTTVESAMEQTQQKVRENGEATFDWRHIRPDGSKWTARIHLMALESPTGLLNQATIQDITQQKIQEEERRNLEQQLAFSQRMESIGRLAGGIAHDFNNLLTIINGYCEVLMLEMSDSQTKSVLEQIRKAGVRASELTQQLLTFSRRQAIRHIPVNINRMISESSEMMRSILGENSRLKLVLTTADCNVMSDPGQIQQVLLNLVVNAKDAMPHGGTLTLSTEEVFLTPANARGLEVAAGEYIQITAEDTGVGMNAKIRQHIFEPFFTTKEDSGTGLGLSTIYGIIRQSNGTIRVTSKEGEGSTFLILLPKSSKAEASQDKVDNVKLPIALDAFRIPVVEDQDDVREYVTSVLGNAGYSVMTAASGNEALALLKEQDENIHLLLTDVVMEGMSGGELAELFSQQYPDIPVLFMSGYPGDELARYGIRAGTRKFLAKPFSPTELLDRVGAILSNTMAKV